MFYKLALKNVTRSMKDYSIYFITLTFGVCIFYVFNSMESQTIMQILGGASRRYLIDTILQLINVLSAFVSVVLAFLVLYANTFMIRRRKRELGTYMLLGLPKGRISTLLFLETLCIGVLALGAGLLLGIFLSQFISVFTAGIFAVRLEEFYFVFSAKALFKTLLYFGIIFLLVMVFNSLTVSRCKLIDLMQAARRSEALRLRGLKASVIMFLTGAVLLGCAYTMLLVRGLLQVDVLFFVMLALGSAGTLLFFRSLSGFLLQVCQHSKRLYYKDLNMFILRQFNSKINTTYLSMTVICLMLLLAIGITACAVGLNNTVEQLSAGQAPFDFSLSTWPESDDFESSDLEGQLKRAGYDLDTDVEDVWTFSLYHVEAEPVLVTLKDGGTKEASSFQAVAVGDFNRLMQMQGRPPLTLADGCYGLVLREKAETYAREELALRDQASALAIAGQSYALDVKAVRSEAILTGMSLYGLLILPEGALQDARVDLVSLCANYLPDVDREQADARIYAAMDHFTPMGEERSYYFETSLNIYMATMGSKMLVLFLGIYLGIIFLLASAAVLALQQLSQAADNVSRYQILSRLGVPDQMRNRSLYIQVLLYFFLPLALAIIHSIVGMTAANAAIEQIGKVDAVASSIVTACFILVVYGAYFLATCWGSRRIIQGK